MLELVVEYNLALHERQISFLLFQKLFSFFIRLCQPNNIVCEPFRRSDVVLQRLRMLDPGVDIGGGFSTFAADFILGTETLAWA
jgi:hypothetical protein